MDDCSESQISPTGQSEKGNDGRSSFTAQNWHREGQNGRFLGWAQKSSIQPYGFEENINTNMKNFESGRSGGGSKDTGSQSSCDQRIDIEKGETVNFEFGLRDRRSDRTDLNRMSIQS